MTRQDLLDEYARRLDAAYQEKWPHGRFVLGRWEHRSVNGEALERPIPTFLMGWEPRRPTSHVRRHGIAVRLHDAYGREALVDEGYVIMPVGRMAKRTFYRTKEALLNAAVKFGVPHNMILLFKQRWDADGGRSP